MTAIPNPAKSYSVDTSALIDGLERFYFEAAFPGIWENIGRLVASGRFFISEEVWIEAQKKDAVVKAWCERDTSGNLVVPTDTAIAAEVTALLRRFPRIVMAMKGRNRADPFVIAVARLRNATAVTGEGHDGTENRPKIPFVCQQLGIECIRFTDLIRQEGWVFR